ncbi:MAG TPA: SAF domain-containing protein, partial [Anaerovoracaceae bacterium]|nr:SAF domain-containing protein [Anaerovoracaceae bacterium]
HIMVNIDGYMSDIKIGQAGLKGVGPMRKLRPVLGILLILLSLAGLFLWEWKGRETITTEEVLVAKEEIHKGALVTGAMLTAKGVPKTGLLEGALVPRDLDLIQGKVAAQLIAKNGQIIMDYFRDDTFYLEQDESIFVIDPGWIAMRSSALRRGDAVDIYGSSGVGLLGTFRVAYVKDEAEREVKDAGTEVGGTGAGNTGSSILERPDSTSVIDHIEIITTFREYEELVNRVSGADGTTPAALIIVQRGDRIDT